MFEVNFNVDGSFDMALTNGIIRVPGQNGCYVLSTGCGSGKTECCKSIICQKFNEGILYCVDTKEELHKMYRWIISVGPSVGIDPSDVMAISSDPEDLEQLRIYQNNPEILMSKKIILLNHVRFWANLINYFLIYNPRYQVNAFDGDFQNLMSRPDLRKFVIFDETPTFIEPFFEMPKSTLASFSYQDCNGDWCCETPQQIQAKYNLFFNNQKDNPFPKGTSRLDYIKRAVIFNQIPKYFGHWIKSKMDMAKITFTPSHLAHEHVNTRMMILEGAGDVLFQNSHYFILQDIAGKYNCKLRFEPFDFNIKRREKLNQPGFDSLISFLTTRIWHNQCCGKKTLVAVWKNQGVGSNGSKDTEYYKNVKSCLTMNQSLSQGMYDVIYYGSAECKSTNQYRDYGEIILAGDWNFTNSDAAKFNQHFGVKIDARSQKLWYFVQLLCRIGIRLYDSREYSVCYSSDFDLNFITDLENYLTKGILPNKEVKDDEYTLLKEYLSISGVRSNYLPEIISLCKYDHFIAEHLIRQEKYSLSISLDEIYKLIPKDDKKKRKYDNLVRVLGKMRITLTIL